MTNAWRTTGASSKRKLPTHSTWCGSSGACSAVSTPIIASFPTNIKHLYEICIMLAQRRRRWDDVAQMLYKCFVFASLCPHSFAATSVPSCRFSLQFQIGQLLTHILEYVRAILGKPDLGLYYTIILDAILLWPIKTVDKIRWSIALCIITVILN